MFRQDRTNPSTAVSNWRGRHDTPKGWPSTAVSTWLNGGLFDVTVPFSAYFGGGLGSGVYKDLIFRVDFPTDTFSVVDATIGTASRAGAGFSNNNTAGYLFGGGTASAQVDEINKFLYESETNSVLGTAMPTGYENSAGLANSPTSGYIGAGYPNTATIRVWTFSSDSYASNATALSSACHAPAGFSNNGTAGYWAGGDSHLDVIDKTLFSNGSLTTLGATLGDDVKVAGGASNSGTAGYVYGGYWEGWDNLNKLTYTSDTNAVISLSSALERYGEAGASNNGVAAYWFCGVVGTTNAQTGSTVKTPYATDTSAVLVSAYNTTGALQNCAGFANCESL